MSRIATAIAYVLMAASACFAQGLGRLPSVIYAGDRGVRNDTTISAVIAGSNPRECVIALDGGDWCITNSMSVPARVGLLVFPGSQISVGTNCNFEVLGDFFAGPYTVFKGEGTASGPATHLYRYPEWGDTNQYNIGPGLLPKDWALQADFMSASNYLAGLIATGVVNTYINMTGYVDHVTMTVTATNTVMLNTNWFEAQLGSNDFAGYYFPFDTNKLSVIPITTNMFTLYNASASIQPDNGYRYMVDGNTNTSFSTNMVSGGLMRIDLLTNYHGYLRVFGLTKTSSTAAGNATWAELYDSPEGSEVAMSTASLSPRYLTHGSTSSEIWFSYNAGATGSKEAYVLHPFIGRYLWIAFNGGGAPANPTYQINELEIIGRSGLK